MQKNPIIVAIIVSGHPVKILKRLLDKILDLIYILNFIKFCVDKITG